MHFSITITNDQFASVNIDFILSMLFLLVILGGVISIAEERLESVQHASESAETRLLSEKIAKSIEKSYSGGEGHEITIEMPSKLDGSDYKVKVNQSCVLVEIKGRYGYSFSYIKGTANKDMSQAEVILFPERTYKIRNVKDNTSNHKVVVFPSI